MTAMYQRSYVVEVERVQRQQVTFVAEPVDNDMLTRIAVAHCQDDCWTETEYRHGNLTSKRVTVTEEDPS